MQATVSRARRMFYPLTFVPSAADSAVQNRIRIASRLSQEITTICAEKQRANGRHFENEENILATARL
jgi:hypothetical protein